jgi:hypothetical protein
MMNSVMSVENKWFLWGYAAVMMIECLQRSCEVKKAKKVITGWWSRVMGMDLNLKLNCWW